MTVVFGVLVAGLAVFGRGIGPLGVRAWSCSRRSKRRRAQMARVMTYSMRDRGNATVDALAVIACVVAVVVVVAWLIAHVGAG